MYSLVDKSLFSKCQQYSVDVIDAVVCRMIEIL